MTKAIVLLSGGVDSATCLGLACDDFGAENVTAVSILYGQKHATELKCAEQLAAYYGVTRKVIDLTEVMQFSDSPLLATSNLDIRHESYAEQIAKDGEGMVDTFVPFRNGLLLSTAAAVAMSIYPKQAVAILYGAHADDAAGRAYPDCSPEFVNPMSEAISAGSDGYLELIAPLINSNKTAVIQMGLEIGVPYELTWSCYEGRDAACGSCATCQDRLLAFEKNNMADPIVYEIDKAVILTEGGER